ncbi:MAG: hypothetical protein ACTSSH_00795 [Candidatus Heimdallarchaeota archaeon]
MEFPEKQVIVDEIILKLESIGLTVNAIYLGWDDWFAVANTDDFDIMYGGLSYTFGIDDIFTLGWLIPLINFHMLRHHDVKFQKLVDKLGSMNDEAMANPDIVTEEYIAEMIDTFQDIEKRLWKKNFVLPYVQWFDGILFTEVTNLNCLKGHVFANPHLRTALFRSIDRNVFQDYHAAFNPFYTYPVYHLFQMSIYHDISLPNY